MLRLHEESRSNWVEDAIEHLDDILLDHQDLISHHWTHIQINNNQKTPIGPLQYYHINSLDLYDATRAIVDKFNIEMVAGKVEKIINI